MSKLTQLPNNGPRKRMDDSTEYGIGIIKKGNHTTEPDRHLRFISAAATRILQGGVFTLAILFLHQSAMAETNKVDLASGVYNDPSSFAITGNLTLDAAGDPNAVWIFQAGSTLDTAVGSRILLLNGAQFANIFWLVGSSATLGTDSSFAGSILAMSSITLNDGADVIGRTLARDGSVSLLGNNTVNAIPEPASILLIGAGALAMLVARRQLSRKKIEEES